MLKNGEKSNTATFPGEIELRTERLVIRNERQGTWKSRLTVLTDKSMSGFLMGMMPPMLGPDSKSLIDELGRFEHEGLASILTVFLSETDQAVGVLALIKLGDPFDDVRLSLLIDESQRGKGVAVEAVERVLTWCFQELDLERISAVCETGNPAAIAVCESVGMRLEGTIKQALLVDNVHVDRSHFAILRSEYLEIHSPNYLKRLETERLILRPFEKKDFRALTEAWNHPVYAELTNHIKLPFTEELAREWIRKRSNQLRDKKAYYFAVELKETAEVIGEVHLSWIWWGAGHSEFGYSVNPAWWNKGFATEALRELLRHAFIDLKLRRILAMTMATNAASRRVLEKLGFSLECVAREEFPKGDVFVDFAHYLLLKSDWEKNTGIA